MAAAGGALVPSAHHPPAAAGTTASFRVADIDTALVRGQTRDGTVVSPKTAINAHGSVARCRDTEGNGVALHSMAD